MKKYLCVGISFLDQQQFWNIEEPTVFTSLKPYGGLWLTEQKYENYNPWVDFLTCHFHLLFFKYENPVKIPSILVTLREDANIFTLANYKDFLFLQEKYPHSIFPFSYKALANDYDGIYLDLNKIICNQNFSKILQDAFWQFGVSSMILFNINGIDYYQSALVHITEIDFDNPRAEVNYSILVDDEYKQVLYPTYDIFLHNLAFKIKSILQKQCSDIDALHIKQLSVYVAEIMEKSVKKEVDSLLSTSYNEAQLVRVLTKKVKDAPTLN